MARSMKEVHTINYYPINEGAARRAKEMNSFSDYKEGSATAEWRIPEGTTGYAGDRHDQGEH